MSNSIHPRFWVYNAGRKYFKQTSSEYNLIAVFCQLNGEYSKIGSSCSGCVAICDATRSFKAISETALDAIDKWIVEKTGKKEFVIGNATIVSNAGHLLVMRQGEN